MGATQAPRCRIASARARTSWTRVLRSIVCSNYGRFRALTPFINASNETEIPENAVFSHSSQSMTWERLAPLLPQSFVRPP